MSLEKEVANELLNEIARLRERIEKLEACVKAADALRPKVTTLSTYDDKRRVELGASYDLARAALGEVGRGSV